MGLVVDLTENRLYRNQLDSNKVVVVKEIRGNEVTFLHAPPIDSDIHWFVPPKCDTLSLSDLTSTYKPFKQ